MLPGAPLMPVTHSHRSFAVCDSQEFSVLSFQLHSDVARVADAMSGYPGRWAFCGGWAVDCWLGRVTRSHLDVDVCVFIEDQEALFAHFADWNLVAHDARTPENRDLWTGRPLEMPAHIHGRPPGEENRRLVTQWVTPPHKNARDGLDFDFEFNERADDAWVLSPEHGIAVPFEEAIIEADGVRVASPEVLAFYKATAYHGNPRYNRPHDEADFEALLPLLGTESRERVGRWISAVHSGHPWVGLLEGDRSGRTV